MTRPPRPVPYQPHEQGERGETLVEILVAVTILGLAAAALLGALGTVTSASALHRRQATAEAAIRSYAEAVKAAGYRDCTTPLTYSPADVSYKPPPGFEASVSGVSYWDGGDFFTPRAQPGDEADCPAATPATPQLLMVTLLVRSTDGQASETVKLTERSP